MTFWTAKYSITVFEVQWYVIHVETFTEIFTIRKSNILKYGTTLLLEKVCLS
jgi:hypothetical protein